MGNKSKRNGIPLSYACACGKRHVKDFKNNHAIRVGQKIWRTQCWLDYSVEQIMSQAGTINIYAKLFKLVQKKYPDLVLEDCLKELEQEMEKEEQEAKTKKVEEVNSEETVSNTD